MSIAISTALGLVYPAFYAPPPEPAFEGQQLFIRTLTLPTLMPFVPYAATILTVGGLTPVRFGIISGVLPPGLTLSLDGHITGTAPSVAVMTPTALPPARVDLFTSLQLTVADVRYPFTMRALDASGQVDDQIYELALWENPTVFSLASGSVPGCLAFAADGTLEGAPLTVGTFPIAVHATDARGRTLTQNYTLTVRS